MDIPKKIQEAILDNKLVVFVGSGLSHRFGLPSWKDLVKAVIERADNKDFKDYIKLLDKGLLSEIEVLEKIKSEHIDVRRYIDENFRIIESDFDEDKFTTHKNIIELCGQIVTTNYDNAFEIASENTIVPAVYTSKFNVQKINTTDSSYVFKIHGSYTEPDKCIVFRRDYDKLYTGEAEAAVKKLEMIFSEKTILFLGFSFSDPDINLVFNDLDIAFGNFIKHYIVTKEPKDFEKYEFLKPIKIDDFKQIDEFVETCLEFKNSNQPPTDGATLRETDLSHSGDTSETTFENKLKAFSKPTNLFTGRKDKQNEIKNAFDDNDIFGVTGIGGIGKTQLVLKLIDNLDDTQRKGITWLECVDSTRFDNFIVAAGFGIIIQSNKTEREKFSAFVDKLNEYQRIVIWDNFHDNKDDAFLRFLDFANGKLNQSKIIIVSRTNQKIRKFKCVELIDFKESVEFAETLIEKRHSNLTLTDTDIEELCDYVKGHPFAIELALNLCESMSLKRVLGKLTKHQQGDKLSQRLFQEILEQESTSQAEKDFIYQFSIFKARVPEAAVEAILGEDCFTILPALRDKYLIEYKEGYYDTHPLIREFCYQKLSNKEELHAKAAEWLINQRTDDLDVLREEHIFHHLKGTKKYDEITETIEKYGRDYVRMAFYEPLREMIGFVRKQKTSIPLFDLLEGDIYEVQSEWNKALTHFEKVKNNTIDEELAVEGQLKCGYIYLIKNDNSRALEIFKKAETISKQKDFQKYIAWAYNDIAFIKERFGIYNETLKLRKEALKICKKLGLEEYIATLYNNIGGLYHESNFKGYNLEKAFNYYNKALKIRKEIGAKYSIAISYINIGAVYTEKIYKKYNLGKALNYYNKGLEINKEIGNKSGIADCYNNIGHVYSSEDFKSYNLETAFEFYNMSLSIRRETDDKLGIATCYGSISTIKYKLKEYKDTLIYVLKAYIIRKQLKAKSDVKISKKYIEYIRQDIGIIDFKHYTISAYEALEPEYQKEITLSDFLNEPRKADKKYGRNEKVKVKYENGTEAEKKYKQVEKDIEAGKCEIIDENT